VTHRILNQVIYYIYITQYDIMWYYTQAPFTMPSSCTAYKCSNRGDQGKEKMDCCSWKRQELV